MTDLDEEFQTAVRRSRGAMPGLGFGLSLVSSLMGVHLPPGTIEIGLGPVVPRFPLPVIPSILHEAILGAGRRLLTHSQPFLHVQRPGHGPGQARLLE